MLYTQQKRLNIYYQYLVLIFWASKSEPFKSKMIYASSKEAIKNKSTYIKYEWHVNGRDEIKKQLSLGEKLGNIVVVSLEGKLIKWQWNTILSVKQLPLLQLSQLE